MTTAREVQSAAQLERLRLATQAAQVRAAAGAQARQAEVQTAAQARQAISETEQQAQAARSEAQREAESRQAEIRKQRGQAEREAEAAKSSARETQKIEQRKVVLPITRPRDLGLTSYISNVETARKQAHQAGESAKVAVTKVRDGYFKEVDKARDAAIADINKQKAGIDAKIARDLLEANVDITKQLANLVAIAPYKVGEDYDLVAMVNDGIKSDTLVSYGFKADDIQKAQTTSLELTQVKPFKTGDNQYDLSAAISAANKGKIPMATLINLFGKEIVSETVSKVQANARQQDAITVLGGAGFVTDSGGGNYSITVRNEAGNLADITTIKAAFPNLDTSQISGLQAQRDAYTQMQNDPQAYFKGLQTEGKVPAYAVYKSIDTKTGEVQYEIPTWNTIDTSKISLSDARQLESQFLNLNPGDRLNIATVATDYMNPSKVLSTAYAGYAGVWKGMTKAGFDKLPRDVQTQVLGYYQDMILKTGDQTKALKELGNNLNEAAKAQLKSAAPTFALMLAAAVLPEIIPVVPAVLGRALNIGLNVAFIGLGTYGLAYTVKNVIPNPDIPTWQKALSIGFDTAAIAAGIYGLKGIRGIKATSIKAGETKITIGKQTYTVPNDLAESVAKTAAVKGGLTAAEEANCVKAIRTIQEGIIAKDTGIVMRGTNMLDKAQGNKVIFGETAHIKTNPAAYIDDAYNAAKAISPTELTANTRFVKTNALAIRESHQTIKVAAQELAKATSTAKAIRAQSVVSRAISTIANVASKKYNTLNRLGSLPKTR